MQHWTPDPPEARRDLTAFTPVPRKYRYDGWTAERQRAFIAALAETGSVTAAARRINMSSEGAYYLRRQPQAEGFRQAWADALASGVQRLTDIAIDRAIEGVPVPVFHQGQQVGEKRWYNDRLLMFLLRHHLPGHYAPNIARAAADAPCPACAEREAQATPEPEEDAEQAMADWLGEALRRYAHKVRAERRFRLSGNIVAADFTLRQLTYIELVLDLGGRSQDLLDLYTGQATRAATEPELQCSRMSEELDRMRRAIWTERAEPAGPPLDLRPAAQHDSMRGGPTMMDRGKARDDAMRRMAEAQALWEACGSEEAWERFTRTAEG